jgi:hypothetical protein
VSRALVYQIVTKHLQYPEVSRALVYQIVTKHLQYRKICARWVLRRPGGRLVRGGNK